MGGAEDRRSQDLKEGEAAPPSRATSATAQQATSARTELRAPVT